MNSHIEQKRNRMYERNAQELQTNSGGLYLIKSSGQRDQRNLGIREDNECS